MLRLTSPCLVVLAGPSGAGKSTWAARHFRRDQIVSSDDLRALVGEGERDQRAGTDAFELLDLVLERRLRRGITTVVDTLGIDPERRRRYLALARQHDASAYVVAFDTPAAECRARNKARGSPVPDRVLAAQIRSWDATRATVADEGFDAVHAPGPVLVIPPAFEESTTLAARQAAQPVPMRFGLQIPRFPTEGGTAELAPRLAAIARAAEDAGFSGIWVMDHFLQIPQVGREWEDMLDSYTTLAFLAAHTSMVSLGSLVTGITYRNIAHLAKIVATLDVVSGGRAVCGVGAAWFEREHTVYGWRFPPVRERFELLEDALQLLPLMWGKGSPAFEGKHISTPGATCYPRPLQEHVPLLIGGSGERRTLRLVARYADACNLFGDAATVRHKVGVLHKHCADVDRDPAEVRVTHLATCLVGRDEREVESLVERTRGNATPEAHATRVNAATVDDHIGRFRALADAGVQTAIVNFADLEGPEAVERFADVIAAFPRPEGVAV